MGSKTVEVKRSSDLNYLQIKTRLGELEELETQLALDVEARHAESVEAAILDQPFELATISDLEARLEQVRRAIQVLEKRIKVFRRSEGR